MWLFLFVQLGFQLGDSSVQLLDFFKDRVGQVRVVKGGSIVILAADDTTGVADNGAVPGNAFQHDRACADLDVFTKSNGAQHLSTCSDHDAVPDGRVTLAVILAGTAKGNALINGHIITNLSGFANDNAGTMIDEEPSSDSGTGMDLNTGTAFGVGRDPSGQQQMVAFIQTVGESMPTQRSDAGVTKQHFGRAAGGRVTGENGGDIFFQMIKHKFLHKKSLLLTQETIRNRGSTPIKAKELSLDNLNAVYTARPTVVSGCCSRRH